MQKREVNQMSEEICSVPNCKRLANGLFREMPLCKPHLEIARMLEWFFTGPVRIPTIAEIKQGSGTRAFAEYALDYFLKMNVKYGAVDFKSGNTAHTFRRFIQRFIKERNLRIYTFQKGANRYSLHGDATVYLVREDLPK